MGRATRRGGSPAESFPGVGQPCIRCCLQHGSELAPEVIVSSLFCMGLADQLAADRGIPWCFVNPSFYFGAHSRTTWEDDWHGSFVPRLARECFAPLVERADMVLHATDPIFDFEPMQLPTSHHYVGFLLWESTQPTAAFLSEPGAPWALVTASTARPADEEIMLQSAATALVGPAGEDRSDAPQARLRRNDVPERTSYGLLAAYSDPEEERHLDQPGWTRDRQQMPHLWSPYGPAALGRRSAWGGEAG